MTIEFLHTFVATGVLLLWLLIVFGWLATCRHGERSEPSREEESLPHSSSIGPKDRSAA
jgi:hypothetical protein